MGLKQSVAQTVLRHEMLLPGERVVVALSGGADSVCLAAVLLDLGYEVHAVHVHHGLRGEEADRDAEFCRAWCEERGVAFLCTRVCVERSGRGTEDAARLVRYEALRAAAVQCGAKKIAVAHHQNDQAETVLMHLLRGSGLSGLCAMEPVRADGIIRPLLYQSRAEIEAYLRENGLSYVQDSTNEDTSYLRNAVRKELLPAAEKAVPDAAAQLAACAERLRQDEAALRALAEAAYARAAKQHAGAVRLDRAALQKEMPAITARVLFLALEAVCGSRTDFFEVHIRDLQALLCAEETGKKLSLPHGVQAQVCYGELWLFLAQAPCREEIALLPGEHRLGRWKIDVHLQAPPIQAHRSGREYLDAVALSGAVIRTRHEGDRFHPLGSTGGKKLKDYLIDKKVPVPVRDSLPLLCREGEVLAVLGMGISERAKVTERTETVLCVTFSFLQEGEEDHASGL